MFANLKTLGCDVAFASVTPPGQEELDYDERVCTHVGPPWQQNACLPQCRNPAPAADSASLGGAEHFRALVSPRQAGL